MRFGLQKLGRFAAGRLQGSKGVQKYDKFMDENAGVRGLLTAGDIAGATLGGAALLGGGLSGAGVKAGLGKMGAAVKSPVSGTKELLTGKVGLKEAAKGTLKFARENKDLIGAGVKGLQMALPDRANEAAIMNAETARQRLALEQDEMDEARRIREARSEMARRLLAPYIDQYSPALRGLLNG
jgi:hypothetical protein